MARSERRCARAAYPPALLRRAREGDLANALARLPDRERLMLVLRYHEGLNFTEIGDVLGVTKARAQELHAKALQALP